MRFITIFLAATFLTNSTFGQTQQESELLKAYKSNSNRKLQKFIETWIKETTFKIDSNEIRSNDTVNNLYEILNSFYNPIYPKTKCILMQENLQYVIVDNLDKDTLMKRIIFKTSRRNPDSVYKAALSNPNSYENLLNDYGDDGFTYLKSGSIKISTDNLKFKSKKLLLLTEKYISILSNYLLDNSKEQRNERTKRLSFIKDEIEFWQGNYGYIRVENAPASISITMDSSYQNAIVGCRGDTSGGKTTLKKVDNKWTVIESNRTWIE